MATPREVSLKGVGFRKSSGSYYFEARIPGYHSSEKLYCNRIKSREEGALCYDILQRYSEVEVVGEKRKAAVELNYPEYSRTLQLEPLRSDLDIRHHKQEAMEIILKQAQAAAKNLPQSLRCSAPVVDSPSPSNRSSLHQNVHGKPLVAEQDSPGVCTNPLNLQKIYELSLHCYMSYTSKVSEKEMLERNVADINEDSRIISFPKPHPNKFTDYMARFKQLMTVDEKIPGTLEVAEQEYKLEDSKCLELRKLLEDHNNKVIGRSLMKVGNETSGRQRANEDERPPRVLEDCPSEEQNGCGVSVLVSKGYGLPGNPLVDVWTDTTPPPAEIGVSQRIVLHEFDKVADEDEVTWENFLLIFGLPETFSIDRSDMGFRLEEEHGSLPEVWSDSDPETPISLWNWDDWID